MTTGTTTAADDVGARRPLKTRQTKWAVAMASWLARRGVTPNAISLVSIAFALLAAGAYVATIFVESPWAVAAVLVVAIAGIQFRLLCNLLDGMVAIEGGRKSTSGEIFNDFPDRVADVLILAAAGYAVATWWGVALGWVAAAMALMTAYVRVLGRSIGAGVYFIGPMAKQHRMAALTAANVIAAVLAWHGWHRWVLAAALGVIVVGSFVTIVRRLRQIVADIEARP